MGLINLPNVHIRIHVPELYIQLIIYIMITPSLLYLIHSKELEKHSKSGSFFKKYFINLIKLIFFRCNILLLASYTLLTIHNAIT